MATGSTQAYDPARDGHDLRGDGHRPVRGGKALRDALFLTSLDITSLPAMLMATSVVSLLLVALNGRVARRLAPAILVPASFLLSGVLFLVEWAAPADRADRIRGGSLPAHLRRRPAAGVRLLADRQRALRSRTRRSAGSADGRRRHARRPPQRAARRAGGRLVRRAGDAAGACRAPVRQRLAGAARWRSGSPMRRCRGGGQSARRAPRAPGCASSPRRRTCATWRRWSSSARPARRWSTICSRRRRSRRSAAAINCCASSPSTTPATSIITFILQTSSSRVVLERFGLGATASTPSLALLLGSIGGLVRARLRQPAGRARRRVGLPQFAGSAPATNCSTRRFRRPRSAPRSR